MIIYETKRTAKGELASFSCTGSVDCDRLLAALVYARDNMLRDSDTKEWLHKVVRTIHATEAGVASKIETWKMWR